MFILPTAKMKTPADNGVFCVDYLASPENGNPRNSKGMAGTLFKPCRFYAVDLAVCCVKTARAARLSYGKL